MSTNNSMKSTRNVACSRMSYVCTICLLLLAYYTIPIKDFHQTPGFEETEVIHTVSWHSVSKTRERIDCQGSKLNNSIEDGVRHYLDLTVPDDTMGYLNNLGFSPVESFDTVKIPYLPVVLFAASSNHFLELQGLIRDLHQRLMWVHPNIKLLFYDLGLTPWQNQQMVKHCNCEVRKFPYNEFPPHLRNLTTYAWKPIIIQMALQEHHFVAYMDASIRLKISDLTDLFLNTKDTGFMYLYGDYFNFEVMQHTDQRMLQFFRLDGCKFLTVTEKQATMVLIADKWLSHFILMKWWVVCALNLDCIAPHGTEKLLFCDPRINKIGKCHRFDQSALNLIIYSIFNNPENHVISRHFINTNRGQMVNYFEE